MLEAIEKLLILQDRDRRVLRLRTEYADIEPQRRLVLSRKAAAEQEFEKSRVRGHQLESERKRLELEVDSKKTQIEKYSAQQWQTKKNEEYKALGHEIEMAREAIRGLDDQQLGLMEQLEVADRHVAAASAVLKQARADADIQLQQFDDAEARLRKQLNEAEAARAEFAASIDPQLLNRYERILKTKGDKILVSVERSVCGGCHMKLARQVILATQADREVVECPNCGRLLYYLPGMDIKAQD